VSLKDFEDENAGLLVYGKASGKRIYRKKGEPELIDIPG
jgi:hypothetical protein